MSELLKSISPWAGAGTSLFGTGINAWLTVWGAKRQERAHAQSIKSQERIFERQFSQEKKVARQRYALESKKLKETKKTNEFNKQQTFVNNFLTTLNTNPQSKMQFIAANRGRM